MSSEGNAIIRFPAETRIARVAVATDETRRTVDIEIITAYTCDLGGAIVAVVKDGEAASEWLGVSNKVRFTAHLDTHQPFGVFISRPDPAQYVAWQQRHWCLGCWRRRHVGGARTSVACMSVD